MRKHQSPCAPNTGHRQHVVKKIATSKRAALTRCTQPVLEQLEDRRLLSSSIAINSGVLTLTGDPNLANKLAASLDSNGHDVHISAGFGHIATVQLSSFKSIKVTGGNVTVGTGLSTIIPGSGKNTITIGNTKDTIVPGSGTNTIKTTNGTTIANPSANPGSTPIVAPKWSVIATAPATSDSSAPKAVME